MEDYKPPQPSRARKVMSALEGDDEFSVVSVSPEARQPMVDLAANAEVKAQSTQASNSVVRFFRKIFGD